MRLSRFIVYLVVLILVFALVPAVSSQGPRVGGTFIGAVIAEDGIVVGADSRSTFIDAAGRHIGYVDGMQKVYVSNTTAVAVSGLTSVEGELFSSFVERNSFLLARSVDEVLFGFSAWLPFKNSTGVLLLSAGFIENQATMCVRSVVQPQACRKFGFITNKLSMSLQNWISSQHVPPKSAAAAAALKQAILESASADAGVGGPVSLVQLRPGAPPLWLENAPRQEGWSTICDLVRGYRGGRVRIVATASQQELDRYLNSSCPK